MQVQSEWLSWSCWDGRKSPWEFGDVSTRAWRPVWPSGKGCISLCFMMGARCPREIIHRLLLENFLIPITRRGTYGNSRTGPYSWKSRFKFCIQLHFLMYKPLFLVLPDNSRPMKVLGHRSGIIRPMALLSEGAVALWGPSADEAHIFGDSGACAPGSHSGERGPALDQLSPQRSSPIHGPRNILLFPKVNDFRRSRNGFLFQVPTLHLWAVFCSSTIPWQAAAVACGHPLWG